MGTYEMILTVAFLILSVLFGVCGVKACMQAAKEKDKQLRKKSRRKILCWMALALMFFLCALYIIFRISWFMLVVLVIGFAAFGSVIGSGVGANMREH